MSGKPEIRLNSVFTFDDHIRCMASKQHLVRARERSVVYFIQIFKGSFNLLDIYSESKGSTNEIRKNRTIIGHCVQLK